MPIMAPHSDTADENTSMHRTVAGLFAVLVLCAASLVVLAGNIGFQGDDWWILAWPFWHRFPEALWLYAKESQRPLEGAYWISIFKVFGFRREAYHLLSLLLSAASCTAMGACLARAFPGRRDFVVLSTCFAFFLPTVSPLTYLIHTDNSRLALLLFWGSVLSFQRWAAVSGTWPGLVAPILLYCLAASTYENGTFLICAVPFFVWPLHARSSTGISDSSFLIRICAGVAGAFGLFLALRFLVFSGGAVVHKSLVPSFHLFSGYVIHLAGYLSAPFFHVSSDAGAWAWAICSAVFIAALVFRGSGIHSSGRDATGGEPGSGYIAGLGALVLALGILPYLLAGYTAEVGFTSQSRVYSSGTFGLAILLALSATAWKSPKLRQAALTVAVVALFFMALFMADLKNDWRQAAAQRKELCAQLLQQAPDVEAGTTFLFLDLQSYVSNRAVIFQGTGGLDEFVKMLYHKKTVNAYFLYPEKDLFRDVKGKTATASAQGIVPRGRLMTEPIPLDSIVMFRKQGTKLAIVDVISEKEHLCAIDWQGISSIQSNLGRIVRTEGSHNDFQEMCLK
ncbi:MAG TPA: hypothetical protein VK463_13690 [Desulfomonilaceae bacterium]|nr:hypothetical protein [Desulfomonilaceae bacterium]